VTLDNSEACSGVVPRSRIVESELQVDTPKARYVTSNLGLSFCQVSSDERKWAISAYSEFDLSVRLSLVGVFH
jgi:hypothetical protein